VCLNVEADEIAPSKPSTSSFCQGQIRMLPVRPRNMPENGNARIRACLLHHSGQQREMVILCEEHRTL